MRLSLTAEAGKRARTEKPLLTEVMNDNFLHKSIVPGFLINKINSKNYNNNNSK